MEVVQNQADAFKYMKANLTFGTDEILGYLKNNLVKDYTEGKIAMSMDM